MNSMLSMKYSTIISLIFATLASVAYTEVQTDSCADGSFFHRLHQDCTPCTICLKGQFTKNECSGYTNSLCMPCPNNTFSSTASFNRTRCSKCTSCTSGQTVSFPCNKTSDTVCRNISASHEASLDIGLVMGFALLFIVM